MTIATRFARQILFLGEEGQRRISGAHVGIVGLGGTGSQLAQALAYLGVGSFVLVDDDRVDETNLNRLVGAGPRDAVNRVPKVHVAARVIAHANPDARVVPIDRNLRSSPALGALEHCPVLFGCVDGDGARLVLTEVAAAYERILIDLASEIGVAEDGKLTHFGGRVVVARPRELCLFCAGELDAETAKVELETAATRAARERHGYGLGPAVPAPSVVSVNGVVANLAATEFLALQTGLREPSRYLRYDALRGIVNRRDVARRVDCFTCGYLCGTREQANVRRYVDPERDGCGRG